MRIKPFADFKSVVYFIFSLGVAIDTYSVYMFWSKLNDDLQINQILANNGLASGEFDLGPMIESFQNIFSIALLLFLFLDYVAYYYFLKHREWARKYVLSIAAFYLLSCFWEISYLQGIYGLLTTYYLWGTKELFLPRKG